MSFILDALKKSETDRQRQTAPSLFEVKVAAPRRRFPPWALGLGALLLLNAGVLAWLALRPDPATPVAAAAATPAATANPALSPGQSTREVTLPATVTFQVQMPPGSPAPVTAEPGVVAPSAAPPLAEGPMLSLEEQSVPPDYQEPDYQPALSTAQAGELAAQRRPGGIPTRDEMLARGTALPELRLDLHVWDNDPAKRFVFINMRKLREGETLPEGVRVEEILPQGARLSYRGSTFHLQGN